MGFWGEQEISGGGFQGVGGIEPREGGGGGWVLQRCFSLFSGFWV